MTLQYKDQASYDKAFRKAARAVARDWKRSVERINKKYPLLVP